MRYFEMKEIVLLGFFDVYKTYYSNSKMELDLVTERLLSMGHVGKNSISNLYEHLSKLIPQLSSFEKDKIPPITNLEYISEYIKKYQFTPTSPLNEQQLQSFIQFKPQYPQWLTQEEALLGRKNSDPKDSIIQNFEQQSNKLFSQVSIGFGCEESALINKAIAKLAVERQVHKIRFWGRIFTQTRDYLIAQGFTLKSISGEPSTPDTEKLKEGVNYNVYWVTQNIAAGDWYELPLITPEQMRTSRTIKQVFSGQLNRPIISSPPFQGQEKHLLKAQIVRITHNCEIAPRGLYATLEDNADEVDFGEEFKMPEFGELSNLQNWVHLNPYILKMGRSNYYTDPKLTEEQKEELLGKLAQTDPKIERLKAINEDKGLEKYGLEGCWSVRTNGPAQVFNNVGKDEGTTSCYGVVALRNPHWPGWVTVASSKQFSSLYLGYGIKASQPSFSPLSPEDLNLEAEDVDEFDEPNPRDPPDALEPDSDDENKKPEE